jgi:hypothetical protein
MIDGALPTMIDEVLIKPGKMSGYAVAPAPLKRHLIRRRPVPGLFGLQDARFPETLIKPI